MDILPLLAVTAFALGAVVGWLVCATWRGIASSDIATRDTPAYKDDPRD